MSVLRNPALFVGGVVLATLLGGCGESGSGEAPGSSGAAATGTATGEASASQAARPSAVSSSSMGSPGATGSTGATGAATGSGSSAGAGANPTSSAVPWNTSVLPSPTVTASAASGTANLTILLDDGFGVRATWTLTCDPAGGSHPHPSVACGVLGANGAKALPAVPANAACTMIYGGPQKVKITGTWRGKAVDSEISRENGCEIGRWEALNGLLPPGGVTQS